MNNRIFTICSMAVLAVACNNAGTKDGASPTDSSEKDGATKSVPHVMPDSATAVKNWMAYSTPGDVHQMMASWDGEWNCEVSSWMAPDTNPEVSKGTVTNKMVMDGRYQQASFSGSMMGQPFRGMSTLAYDNAKKKFISTWIDNMGTGVMMLEGPWDKAAKSMTLTGKMIRPDLNDGTTCDIKEVFKVIDDKTQLMEMYVPAPDGRMYKNMEMKYTRK